MIKDFLFIGILGIAACYDLKERIVPNKLIYSGIIVGAVSSVISKEYDKIIAAILVFLFLYVIFYKFIVILPGGDIKALVFITLIKGTSFLVESMYPMIIFTIPLWIYYWIKEKKSKTSEYIPLVVPMFLGCLMKLGEWYVKVL